MTGQFNALAAAARDADDHRSLEFLPWFIAEQVEVTSGVWLLDRPDRNGRWHRYDGATPSPGVGPLLAEIQADANGVSWGQETLRSAAGQPDRDAGPQPP